MSEKRRGAERALKKLEADILGGRFYEALQMYKTLASRYGAQPARHEELRKLLLSGIDTMLTAKEFNCAVELIVMLLEHYHNAAVLPDAEAVTVVSSFFDRFPLPLYQRDTLRPLIQLAVKWSTVPDTSYAEGAPALHNLFGAKFTECQDFASASTHFLRGDDAKEFVKMLVKWSKKGPVLEQELYITRAVLQILCWKRLNYAHSVFSEFCKRLYPEIPCDWTSESGDVAPPGTARPLINFVHFLLITLERDAVPVFKSLRKRYAKHLNRDADFGKLLDVIGKVYYDIQPTQPMSGNIFQNIMSSMMGGGGPGGAAPNPFAAFGRT